MVHIMTNIKVSIIIPVFNAEKTVKNTLKSILKQSFSNIEVLVVDDGSTDNSLSICKRIAESDDRIKVLTQTNLGASVARNLAISCATGDYLVFVDADDTLPDNAVEILLSAQRLYKGYFICCSYQTIKTRNRRVCNLLTEETVPIEDTGKFLDVALNVPTAPWGKLFEKRIIETNGITFPEGIRLGEDAIFLYLYLPFVKGIHTSSDVIYHYHYLDSDSAGRKYYDDYDRYIKTMYLEKKKLFDSLGIDTVALEECVEFRKCLSYYTIHNISLKKIEQLLRDSVSFFPEAIADPEYGVFIKNERYIGMIGYWVRKNLHFFMSEKIKRFIWRFFKSIYN